MSVPAIKDLHLATVTIEPPFGPELVEPTAPLASGLKAETEVARARLRSGRLHPLPDRENLEPHWAAAIDAATD